MTLGLETTGLNQLAVLWVRAGVDRYGKARTNAPIEIPVRWEYGRDFQQVAETASEQVVATVYVDRDIPLKSIMRLGPLNTLPDPLNNLHQVIAYKQSPDIKGRTVRRSVSLSLYNDTIPEAIS